MKIVKIVIVSLFRAVVSALLWLVEIVAPVCSHWTTHRERLA